MSETFSNVQRFGLLDVGYPMSNEIPQSILTILPSERVGIKRPRIDFLGQMIGVLLDDVFGKGDFNEVCAKIMEIASLLGEDSVTEFVVRELIAMKNLADARRIDENRPMVANDIQEKLHNIEKNSTEGLKAFTSTFPDVGHGK
jgi:hypothetical protein